VETVPEDAPGEVQPSRPAAAKAEPLNPFYMLLLVAGLLFVITALAYAIVPVLEQRAIDAGEIPPPSPWRDALRRDGWRWLLYELAAIAVLSLASMWLDRVRALRESGGP
jgi:hypothetical protein